jgi:hypothetical protein
MRSTSLFLGSFVLFVACSSGPGAVAEVSADQACSDYAAAFCDLVDKCGPFFLKLGYGDAATCKTRAIIECPQVFKANGTSATPAKLEQCKLDAASLACEDLLAYVVPTDCVPSPGSLVDGTACGDDAQCKSTYCSKKDGVCGVCAALPSAGGPCVNNSGFLGSGDCGRGLTCANKICVKPKRKDETGCDSTTAPCVAGLSCYGGKCVTAATVDQPCDGGEKTNPNCDFTKGLFCAGVIPANKKCKAIGTVGDGQPCGLLTDTLVLCAGGGFCKGATATTPGTCLAPAKDGATCDNVNGPGCLGPAKCVSGQCKLPDPTTCK